MGAWVTRPDHLKVLKDKVKQAQSWSEGPLASVYLFQNFVGWQEFVISQEKWIRELCEPQNLSLCMSAGRARRRECQSQLLMGVNKQPAGLPRIPNVLKCNAG